MNNKNKKIIFGFVSVAVLIGLSFLVYSTAVARGLVPCGGTGEEQCTICHFVIGISDIMNYIYRIVFVIGIAIFAIAGVMYTVSAGDSGMTEMAKKAMKNAVIGIVVIFGAWLIVNTTLRLLGTKTNLGIEGAGKWNEFQCAGAMGTSGLTGAPATGGIGAVVGGATCSRSTEIKSGQPVCSGNCSLQSCINSVKNKSYYQYITKYAPGKENIITAIICRESSGNENTPNSPVGACGLMQVMPNEFSAGENCKDPETNIRKGVELFEKKLESVAGKSYGGNITKEQMAFAAYNCCKNGDNPNAQSVSCSTAEGWPSLPKWACPLSPGTGIDNMCKVRDYTCQISACI